MSIARQFSSIDGHEVTYPVILRDIQVFNFIILLFNQAVEIVIAGATPMTLSNISEKFSAILSQTIEGKGRIIFGPTKEKGVLSEASHNFRTTIFHRMPLFPNLSKPEIVARGLSAHLLDQPRPISTTRPYF
jgi:hypothetical protein